MEVTFRWEAKVFAQITGEMTIEIPEGTYTAAVANNGYGGSTEITITRGQETVLDLETLKGEGPKYGSILFAVNVEGAWLPGRRAAGGLQPAGGTTVWSAYAHRDGGRL